jgi:hypothetical protein
MLSHMIRIVYVSRPHYLLLMQILKTVRYLDSFIINTSVNSMAPGNSHLHDSSGG